LRYDAWFHAFQFDRQVFLGKNSDCSSDIGGGSIDVIARAKPGSELQLDGINAGSAVTAVGLRGMAAAIT
jgi:hypothetical protein